MDSKNKAFTLGAAAVAILFVAMVVYYKVAERTRTTESDVDVNQRVEQKKEERSEFAGTYGASEPVEGNGKRFASFTVSRRDDGGYGGIAKLDLIGGDNGAANANAAITFTCVDVKIAEKDFFLKCLDPSQGSISYSGEWQKEGSAIRTSGHLIWSKDGTAFIDKNVALTHLGGE